MRKILIIAALHVSDEVTDEEIDFLTGYVDAALSEPYLNEFDREPNEVGQRYFLRHYTGDAVAFIEGALSVGVEGAPEEVVDEATADRVWADLQELSNLNLKDPA